MHGPLIASGSMMALTREPSRRRASTSGWLAVDAPAERRHDPLDHGDRRLFRGKRLRDADHAPVALDVNLRRRDHHDFRDARAPQQVLQRTEAEDHVVQQLLEKRNRQVLPHVLQQRVRVRPHDALEVRVHQVFGVRGHRLAFHDPQLRGDLHHGRIDGRLHVRAHAQPVPLRREFLLPRKAAQHPVAHTPAQGAPDDQRGQPRVKDLRAEISQQQIVHDLVELLRPVRRVLADGAARRDAGPAAAARSRAARSATR